MRFTISLAVILFASVPVLFAQQAGTVQQNQSAANIYTEFPDSLIILKKAELYQCYVKAINDKEIIINSNGYESFTVPIQLWKELKIEKLGTIYTAEKGFIVDISNVQKFITSRDNEKETFNTALLKFESRKKETAKINTSSTHQFTRPAEDTAGCWNKFSFGVMYYPYTSAVISSMSTGSNSSPKSINRYYNSRPKIEGSFIYKVHPKWRLIANIGYTTAITEDNYDSHTSNNGSTSNYEVETESNMKLLSIDLSTRYYVTNLFSQKSAAFVFAGIGKQFASVNNGIKYPDQSSTRISESNSNDFLEDINSPYQLNTGFGAEYYFNESLSLVSQIRFIYSHFSGDYESRLVGTGYEQTEKQHYSNSEVETEIGFGLNFYF